MRDKSDCVTMIQVISAMKALARDKNWSRHLPLLTGSQLHSHSLLPAERSISSPVHHQRLIVLNSGGVLL